MSGQGTNGVEMLSLRVPRDALPEASEALWSIIDSIAWGHVDASPALAELLTQLGEELEEAQVRQSALVVPLRSRARWLAHAVAAALLP